MSRYIHGIHDVTLADLMGDRPGHILITEAIGHDHNDYSGGNYTAWTDRGFEVTVRLNNGYGSGGTIPGPEHYAAFAQRCANYVERSPGCDRVIIANETNHFNERPGGQVITPTQYAKCYDLCYSAVKSAKPSCQVAPAPVAPWDATTTYPGNEKGDWIAYWQELLMRIARADFLAIHTYTHGSSPDLITDNSRMAPPFENYHYNFRAYRDFLEVVPHWFQNLAVYITETDQINPWLDHNNGWVQAAYRECDDWNKAGGQPIHALCLYRSNEDDQWTFTHKAGVHDDFRAAVARGYVAPTVGTLPPVIEPLPPTNPPENEEIMPPGVERDIDPALFLRGVEFDFVSPPAGTDYWRITEAYWFENAAADIGPDHHILGDVSADGREKADVPLRVEWPSGETTVISKAPQANFIYNYDFPMGPSLNEYSIQVDDGKPSDKAMRIGMGKNGNSREHTSTWVAFELVKATVPVRPEPPDPEPPRPTPPAGQQLWWPVNGPVSQRWGENPEFYQQRLGIPYHNGIDIAVPVGTPVIAAADGKVKWVASDPEGYGMYCRVFFPEFNQHQLLAHLSEVDVQVGQLVGQGDTLGASGNTGLSSGPHVHMETRLGTENAYFQGTFGHSNGRVDPQAVYGALGMPQQPVAGPGR